MHFRDESEIAFLHFWNLQWEVDCFPYLVSFKIDAYRALQNPQSLYLQSNSAAPAKFFGVLGLRALEALAAAPLVGSGEEVSELPKVVMFMLLPHVSLLLRNAMHPAVAVYPVVGCSTRKTGIECVEHLLPRGPPPRALPLVEHAEGEEEQFVVTDSMFQSLSSDLRLWTRYLPELDRTRVCQHLSFLDEAIKSLQSPAMHLSGKHWQYNMPRLLHG